MKTNLPNHSLLTMKVSRPVGIVACMAMTVLLFAIDLQFSHVNIPILYVIPLLVYSQTMDRKGMGFFTLTFIVLTYAKIVIEKYFDQHAVVIEPYRLINRTMVVVAIGGSCILLLRWIKFRLKWEEERKNLDANGEKHGPVFMHAFRIMQSAVAILLSLILIALIFMSDYYSQPQYNLPILYIIPLIIVGFSCTWRITSIAWIVLITLSIVGYFVGPTSTTNLGPWANYVLYNRMIACVGIVMTGGLMYFVKRLGF